MFSLQDVFLPAERNAAPGNKNLREDILFAFRERCSSGELNLRGTFSTPSGRDTLPGNINIEAVLPSAEDTEAQGSAKDGMNRTCKENDDSLIFTSSVSLHWE